MTLLPREMVTCSKYCLQYKAGGNTGFIFFQSARITWFLIDYKFKGGLTHGNFIIVINNISGISGINSWYSSFRTTSNINSRTNSARYFNSVFNTKRNL